MLPQQVHKVIRHFSFPPFKEISIIVVGNVHGDLEKLDEKLTKLAIREGPKCVYVSGQLFGEEMNDEYRTGSKRVQTPINVLGPTTPTSVNKLRQGEMVELIPNVTYVGKMGISVLPGGVTAAHLSGVEGTEQAYWSFTEEDVQGLIMRCRWFKQIDLLFTSQWPSGLDTSLSDPPITVKSPSKLIRHLVASIKPKIHVAAMEEVCFISPPMVHSDRADLTTRFIGLASLDKGGESWMCSIRLPLSGNTPTVPSPFGRFPAALTGSVPEAERQDGPSSSMMNSPRPVNTCWYCRSNPPDSSLVIARGHHVYLAYVRSPIVNRQTLIAPMSHVEKLAGATEGVMVEINKILKLLAAYYSSMEMEMVWYEECQQTPHVQLHVLPTHQSVISQNKIPMEIDRFRLIEGLPRAETVQINEDDWRRKVVCPEYVYFEVWGKAGYLINLLPGQKLPVEFGRRILAEASGVPNHKFCHSCVENRAFVAAAVATFRREFGKFNILATE